MNRQQLLDLAERVEREEPSEKIDFDVLEAITPNNQPWTYRPYTTSLDAAVTLVPDGWLVITLSDIAADGLPFCKLGNPETNTDTHGIARRMVQALTAAALRARALEGDR